MFFLQPSRRKLRVHEGVTEKARQKGACHAFSLSDLFCPYRKQPNHHPNYRKQERNARKR